MAQFSINDNVLEMFGGEHDMEDEYKHVGRKDQKLFKSWGYSNEKELEYEWIAKADRKKSVKDSSRRKTGAGPTSGSRQTPPLSATVSAGSSATVNKDQQ